MLKERNTNGSEGGYSPQAARDADLRQVLVEHGIASEHINEVLEQLNVLVDTSPNGGAMGNSGTPNGTLSASAVLSENAHIILKQRYLMRGRSKTRTGCFTAYRVPWRRARSLKCGRYGRGASTT